MCLISSGKKGSMVRSTISDDMMVCGDKEDWSVVVDQRVRQAKLKRYVSGGLFKFIKGRYIQSLINT